MHNKNNAALSAAVFLIAMAVMPAAMAADGRGGVGPYPSLPALYDEITALAESHPGLVEVEAIGFSVEGRPIYVIRIGRKDGVERPQALITANIHACEVLSSKVAVGVAQRLVSGDGRDPWVTSLLDRAEFWIVPVINPDGYNAVIEGGGKGLRKNVNGVDLNRNYPLAPGARSIHPMSGNRRPDSSYYMGPAALSEPETKAIADFVAGHEFFAATNGHTVAGKFLYPHGFTRVPANHRAEFERMGKAFQDAQPDKKYKVQISCSWYPTLGDMDDYLYMQHGIMSVTVEHGTVGHNLKYAMIHPRVFWVANPIDAQKWVENDRDAILAALEEALEITGGKPLDPEKCHPRNQ